MTSPAAPLPPIYSHRLGPQEARDLSREVLLADGLGGFALSSPAGVPTRCYSGLAQSLRPPVQRQTMFITALETLEVAGRRYALHAFEVAPGTLEGDGLNLLSHVDLNDLLPTRVQLAGGVRVSRTSFVPHRSGTLVQLYEIDAPQDVTLTLGALLTHRDMHAVCTVTPKLEFLRAGADVTVSGSGEGAHLIGLRVFTPAGAAEGLRPQPVPQRLHYRLDTARGAPDTDRAVSTDLWRVMVPAGRQRLALVVGEPARVGDPWAAHAQETRRRHALIAQTFGATGVQDSVTATLALSADSFLVERQATPSPARPDVQAEAEPQEVTAQATMAGQTPERDAHEDELLVDDQGAAPTPPARPDTPAPVSGLAGEPVRTLSVIAGYPWFADWGRDSMIALTGLTLVTGRLDEARQLLTTFLDHLRGGLTPNNFHDDGSGAGYNTVDGALWLIVALERYLRASSDADFARRHLDSVREILRAHLQGTEFGIRADPQDGLLLAGEVGVQLTWMDVKIHDWVVTPRHGKPVEIQALWLAALAAESRLSQALVQEPAYSAEVLRARAAFLQLWNEEGAYLYDSLTSDGRADPTIRPNALLALALPDTPAVPEQLDAALLTAGRELLTPLGLRTLAVSDPRYLGNYGGSQLVRDAAYHQGTVWPWPLGAYVELLLRRGRVAEARAALDGLVAHLWEAGLGSVSEVFSGDTLTPGGCAFQAWSVSEVLRAHVLVCHAERAAGEPG
ncbi:amylo-alpha-1,6-glucosidase [Deinococcus aquiradiocola]|uniref:amylo-alpha-1,6-glucosidase n=1 Tax=Deinococcus aquiradiocola TaxID=393059 RepID=UPI001E3B0D58|nr:amylo-alpha-1,6-glucosidase [Deinococcus aquiradiocola]